LVVLTYICCRDPNASIASTQGISTEQDILLFRYEK
jgi:hypothetical protein